VVGEGLGNRDQVGPLPAPFNQVKISERPTPDTPARNYRAGIACRHSDGSFDLKRGSQITIDFNQRDDVHCVILNVRRNFRPLTPVRPPRLGLLKPKPPGGGPYPPLPATPAIPPIRKVFPAQQHRGPRNPAPCRFGC